MAFTRSTLRLAVGESYGAGPRTWTYTTADTPATVRATDYFANTKLKGVKAGDYILVSKSGGGAVPYGMRVSAVDSDGNATVSGNSQELTVTGAVLPGVQSVELNHASTVIAATMVATAHPGLFIVKDTSATGTAAHTLTVSGGTFNGTATVATLNARDEFLAVYFDSAGRGQIIVNVGSVGLT